MDGWILFLILSFVIIVLILYTILVYFAVDSILYAKNYDISNALIICLAIFFGVFAILYALALPDKTSRKITKLNENETLIEFEDNFKERKK